MREGEALSLTELAFADARSEVSAEELTDYRRDDSAAVDDGRIQSKVTEFWSVALPAPRRAWPAELTRKEVYKSTLITHHTRPNRAHAKGRRDNVETLL